MKHSYWRYFLLYIIFSLLVTACVVQRSPVTGHKHAYGFSWAQGKKMGAEAAKQVKAVYGIYQDKQLQDYVQSVAHKVLEHSDLRGKNTPAKYRNTPIHYHVIDNPVINAFTLPGGYIYVDRGLLTHLENEAQLAMIIGHETGHAAARHSAQQAFSQKLGQLALVGGAIAGQKILGVPAGNILNIGSAAEKFLFLKYSRDDEKEADRLGVKYSAKAGYKAAEGTGLFQSLQRMAKKSGANSVPAWQQTHPDPGSRIKAIQKAAKKWEQKGYSEKIVHQNEYMQAIKNMVYGDNPRHGFTKNGVFYHPELAFKFPYPKSWQVQNLSSVVQMVNSDQNAIIQFQIDSKNNSPKASVDEFLNQDGIDAGSGKSTSFHGLKGYRATATGQTQDGNKVAFYLYSVSYKGNIYRFICYTFAGKYDHYQSTFKNTTHGFSQLTDKKILNIKPARLHVFRAPRTASFKSFLPKHLPLDIKPEEVAVANQVELNDTIKKGAWIKIPRQ
jgi:predicted Zn-dependent protease